MTSLQGNSITSWRLCYDRGAYGGSEKPSGTDSCRAKLSKDGEGGRWKLRLVSWCGLWRKQSRTFIFSTLADWDTDVKLSDSAKGANVIDRQSTGLWEVASAFGAATAYWSAQTCDPVAFWKTKNKPLTVRWWQRCNCLVRVSLTQDACRSPSAHCDYWEWGGEKIGRGGGNKSHQC